MTGEAVWVRSKIAELRGEEAEWVAQLVRPGWGVYLPLVTGGYLIAAAIDGHHEAKAYTIVATP